MTENELTQKRTIRSFVLRQGRLTKAQQRALDTLFPKYGLKVTQQLIDWSRVFGREAPLILEIGFGMGQSLVEQAKATPEVNFIGVEVHRPGIGSTLAAIDKLQLNNLRVVEGDALEVLKFMIPEHSLTRVQLFFPDPWPKKRHHKRRIVNAAFADLVASRLKPNGHLHMATDWTPYAEHMLEVMEAHPDYENIAGPGNYTPRPDYRPLTKFEQRGERLGHQVHDLIYCRKPSR
ncbi:MAG: tRNA (guanosine(46)-N7)-methyltransferase TrmB [Gammaproteobacteria bacterium]|nr:MAG: tRNA (guanosine(46)-N7)-methyltransferase TrmB [Gammaproteobacteria bacterium]